MSSNSRHPITLKRVVYRLEGMEAVPVRRDIEYASTPAGPLTFDLYRPRPSAERAPVVVLVTGYPDVGVARPLGCAFKDMEMWISLGQLLAASGIAAVGYTTEKPGRDGDRLLEHLSTHASELGVDATRTGLWAVSGHVPTALRVIARHHPATIQAAVLSTGFTLDFEGSTVADAARTYGFWNGSAGMSFEDLRGDVPLFIARAGRDENPGLNAGLDRFAAAALAHNWPVAIVNHATAGHAFELNADSAETRHLISQMLGFMRFWLTR